MGLANSVPFGLRAQSGLGAYPPVVPDVAGNPVTRSRKLFSL